jgi:hypothetical protein
VLTLNILEVLPEGQYLAFGVGVAKAWIGRFPEDTTFWIDYGVGGRVCGWLDATHKSALSVLSGDSQLRREIEQLLSDLIRVGVAEAGQLETALSLRP